MVQHHASIYRRSPSASLGLIAATMADTSSFDLTNLTAAKTNTHPGQLVGRGSIDVLRGVRRSRRAKLQQSMPSTMCSKKQSKQQDGSVIELLTCRCGMRYKRLKATGRAAIYSGRQPPPPWDGWRSRDGARGPRSTQKKSSAACKARAA